jgi:hypothetical protein
MRVAPARLPPNYFDKLNAIACGEFDHGSIYDYGPITRAIPSGQYDSAPSQGHSKARELTQPAEYNLQGIL